MAECMIIVGTICFLCAILGVVVFVMGAGKGKTEQERLYEDQEQVRFLRERKQKHLQKHTTN